MYKEFLAVLDDSLLLDFELVCYSLNIRYIIEKCSFYSLIYLHEDDFNSAVKNFNEFLNETLISEEEESSLPILDDKVTIFSHTLILSFFIFFFYYLLSGRKYFIISIGANDAYKVINGEFYRCITALFIHANFFHLISNMIFFLIIFKYVIKIFGEGLGWLLIFLSGFLGNLITSYLYQNYHSSIGFSTSVFGTIGILSNVNIKLLKSYIPVIAGFFLFIMLGGGKNVDVIAHISGFFSGIILVEILLKRFKNLIKFEYQKYFKITLCSVIILSWLLALYFN